MAVIPHYNHIATLRTVAQKTLAVHPHVLVVDDGSSQDPASALAGLDVKLVRHAFNQGKGAAILTGAREAKKMGMSHIVTIDADGQHDPAELPKFLEALQAHPFSVIMGRRDLSGANAPAASRFGRAFGNFWARLQTGQKVGDIQSGFRGYPVDVLLALTIWTRGYAFEVESAVRAAWAGLALRSIDIPVHYPPGKERISHFDMLTDNVRLGLLNAHLTMRSILPWPHHKVYADAAGETSVTLLRPVRSLRNVLTENVTPAQLALAVAGGVLLGALPLFALHTIAIIFAMGFLGLNKPVAVACSQLCMPPIVPAICIQAGHYMRHDVFLTEISLQTLGYQALDRLWEWCLGSLVVAPVLAMMMGGATYLAAQHFKRRSNQEVV